MANVSFELEASSRQDMGKGASRRLRRNENLIPAIVYGADKEAIKIALPHHKVVKALENEAVYSHILDLKIDGKSEKVVLKDMQRHPYKPLVMHMDFLRISATHKLTMYVPIHFINEDICAGCKVGGVISHQTTEVEVRCLPKDLPEFIEVDMAAVELDTTLHLSDLKVSSGVEITAISHGHDNDNAVVSVHLPRVITEEVTDEAAAEEGDAASADTDK